MDNDEADSVEQFPTDLEATEVPVGEPWYDIRHPSSDSAGAKTNDEKQLQRTVGAAEDGRTGTCRYLEYQSIEVDAMFGLLLTKIITA